MIHNEYNLVLYDLVEKIFFTNILTYFTDVYDPRWNKADFGRVEGRQTVYDSSKKKKKMSSYI